MYSTDCERRVEEFEAKPAKIPSGVKKRARRRMDSKLRHRTRAKCSEAPEGRLEGRCSPIYRQTGRRTQENQVK